MQKSRPGSQTQNKVKPKSKKDNPQSTITRSRVKTRKQRLQKVFMFGFNRTNALSLADFTANRTINKQALTQNRCRQWDNKPMAEQVRRRGENKNKSTWCLWTSKLWHKAGILYLSLSKYEYQMIAKNISSFFASTMFQRTFKKYIKIKNKKRSKIISRCGNYMIKLLEINHTEIVCVCQVR